MATPVVTAQEASLEGEVLPPESLASPRGS
jgi:hypothetical protein